MGMYTELVMGVNLKKDTPATVIKTLEFMLGEISVEPKQLPEHPLFATETRYRFMLTCDSYYFHGDTMSKLRWDKIGLFWSLTIRCNLKNYNDEIAKFIDWLTPYFETEGFYGYTRYEEADDPTLLFHRASQ